MSGFIMGCSLDNLAFKSAQEALQHYNGKKHRNKIDRHLKNVMQESFAIHIKDASRVAMTNLLNYFATLGSIQTVHVEKGVGLNDTFFHSAVIYYDSETTATEIRQSRHAVDCIPIGVSRYYVYDDPNRPKTPPPPASILALDHDFIDQELRKLRKAEKLDLDHQIDGLTNLIQLRSHEPFMRKDICNQLQALFRVHLNPQCEVHPVGSSVNGLGFQGCDLDAIVYLKHAFPEKLEEESFEKWRARCREKEKSFVLNAGKILRDHSKANVSNVGTILTGVPTIKFLHDQTGIKVNLNFKSRMSVLTTEFLQLCLGHDARIRPLCLVIKYWAHRYKLSGSCDGSDVGRESIISNYALILMIIFFLQKEEILPAVKELQDEMASEESEKIDFWQFGYSKMVLVSAKPAKPNRRPVSRLLFKFFDFYANFKYNDLVISTFLGRHITKETFEIPRRSRSILPAYAINVESGKSSPLNVACPLAVQDPFELNNNLTSEFNSDALHIWKRIVHSAKKEFHEKKLYKLFDLQDLPSKLKLRLESIKSAPENSNAALSESSETVPEAVQPSTSQPGDSTSADTDTIFCDESDRVFVAVCSLNECHDNYKKLLQRDPQRRLMDKFILLIEIIVDHILNQCLRIDHADEVPLPYHPFPSMFYPSGSYPPMTGPPMGMPFPVHTGPGAMLFPGPQFPTFPGAPVFNEDSADGVQCTGGENDDNVSEPVKKKSRKKSRWEPAEEVPENFVDRKRLSEFEYAAFFPVWSQRKFVRKTFNLYEKSLANETSISEKLIETQCFNVRRGSPIATFKAWSHHSKIYENAICVHIMELESSHWTQIWKFFKEYLPQWTTYALQSGEIEISHL